MRRPATRLSTCSLILSSSLLLGACAGQPVISSVETFCQRVDRFHATDGERAFLKANSGPLERLIRWVAGINDQWDATCLKPAPGP